MPEPMITAAQVRHIASLAQLEFDEEQIELFTRQLGSILAYFERSRATSRFPRSSETGWNPTSSDPRG
ncbi:MAG: hypothetical protein DMF49_11185 [Acidobacteria bacterium]|nr:MAG: hypothetical protein DMF49_11185 [Acidobacteriota bacterium]